MLVITYSGHNLLDHKFLVSLKRKRCRLAAISSQDNKKGYDAVIRFPARESYDEKIAVLHLQKVQNIYRRTWKFCTFFS